MNERLHQFDNALMSPSWRCRICLRTLGEKPGICRPPAVSELEFASSDRVFKARGSCYGVVIAIQPAEPVGRVCVVFDPMGAHLGGGAPGWVWVTDVRHVRPRQRYEPWYRAKGERMERALEEQDRRDGITRRRTASGWLVFDWPGKKAAVSPAFLVDGAPT